MSNNLISAANSEKNNLAKPPFETRVAWPHVILTALASLLVLAAFSIAASRFHISVGVFTRDICATQSCSPHVGSISQIGIFCWFSMATLCLFCAVNRRADKSPINAGAPNYQQFFKVSGISLLLVGIDDAFMMHEYVLPKFGISEKIVYAIYFLSTLIYLIRFGKTILQTKYFYVVWAGLFFALSVIINEEWLSNPSIEDAAKFVGIVSLLVYFISCANAEINRQLHLSHVVTPDVGAATPLPNGANDNV